jgi:type IV secretion system protein TrbI
MGSDRSEARRAADSTPPPAPAPGERPALDVKRLNSKPVVIAGAALLFVILAVVFFVTSRPANAGGGDVDVSALGGDATQAGTAEFLNNDPAAPPPPGPACQGLECAAVVAAGQTPVPGMADTTAAAMYGTQPMPGGAYPADPYAVAPGVDPYAVQYAPPPAAAAPAPAPEQQECDRRCRFRQAREARLRGDNAGAAAGAVAARPSYQPDAMGLMPDNYYAAMTDSIITADLAQHYGVTPGMLTGDSGRNGTRSGAATAQPSRQQAAPAPRSPYVVTAGTIIPASLVTAINTEQCGDVTAQVTRDVYDARMQHVLIPAGSQLLGTCDNQVAAGQTRLAVAWTQLRFPTGRTVVLPGMPSHSADGSAGVRDKVNNHWGRVFGTAILLSAISAGTQLAIPQDADGGMSPASTAATAAAAELSSVATEILRKQMDVKPTLDLRTALPFVVFVAADLDVGAPSRRGGGTW